MAGGLAWTELPGGLDCRATGTFYARVFGWDVDDDGAMVRFRDPSGTLVGAFVGELPPATGGGTVLYLSSDDAEATVARATAEGATLVLARALVAPGVGYRALVRDPAGCVVGVFEPWHEAAAADRPTATGQRERREGRRA